jgi:hypothetical protein
MTTTFRLIEKENPFFPEFQNSRILGLIISRIPFSNFNCSFSYSVYEPERRQGP